MRMIKLGLISIFVFGMIALFISFLFPAQIEIIRSIELPANQVEVYNQISTVDSIDNWLINNDSIPTSFTADGKKKVFHFGNSKMWIVSADDAEVVTNWQVNNGPIVTSSFIFKQPKDSTNTLLQWSFIQKVKWYPWEKFALIASEKGFGDFMERSLEDIKTYMQKKEEENDSR